ncbi:GntR family transcriptional regulator [Candidatus Mycoplasma pogonae]
MTTKEQIVCDYIKSLMKEEYYKNNVLPSENFLMNKFAFSRQTIRNALQKLVSKNIIYSVKGKGYFCNLNYFNVLNSFSDQYGNKASNVFIKVVEHTDFNPHFKTNHWYEIIKIRYFENKPFIYTRQHVEQQIFQQLNLELSKKSLYAAFDEAGLQIDHAIKTIEVVDFSEDILLFAVNKKSHGILLTSFTYAQNKKLLEYSQNYYYDNFTWSFIENFN